MSSVPVVVTKNYSNQGKIKFLMVLAAICGLFFSVQAIPVIFDYRFPVVEGSVVSRRPILLYGHLPRSDFTIQISGQDVKVHAITGRYLLDEIPNQVSFRYSGDSSRNVFLFEYEENPIWLFLFCWSISAICFGVLRFSKKSRPTNYEKT
jgi:hypothetical protein